MAGYIMQRVRKKLTRAQYLANVSLLYLSSSLQRDPKCHFHGCLSQEGDEDDLVHVQFFDSPRPTTAWIDRGAVEKMESGSLEVAGRRYPKNKDLERALKEARVALGMGLKKRAGLLVMVEEEEEKENEEIESEEEERPKKKRKRRKDVKKKPVNEEVDKQEKGDDDDDDDPERHEMSEYELIRLKNIERRKKIMEDMREAKKVLGEVMPSSSASNNKRPPSRRGLAAKSESSGKSEEPAAPSRRSLRLQNIDADTGLQVRMILSGSKSIKSLAQKIFPFSFPRRSPPFTTFRARKSSRGCP